MKKKFLVGTVFSVLTGIGFYKFINARQNGEEKVQDAWTTADIPDLTGKVMIVTGANSGLGLEATKAFCRRGAQTIMACRNMDKAQTALAEIQAEMPQAPVEVMALDLASQASVHQFSNAFKARYGRLDVLVNNAGIMMVPYDTTEDGFESQLGTNHLGHFALTGLLLELLLTTPGSRVVNVSSTGHRFGTMDFDNLMYEEGEDYSPVRAYGRSKLANLLFTYELQRRYEAVGADAIAVAAHPGSATTNLSHHLKDVWYFRMLLPVLEKTSQSAAMGALPTIRAAVDPAVQGGTYYGPGGFMEQGGYPVVVESSDASHNRADAQRLWQVSEALTGVRYEALDKVKA